jgi:hypothetical protein
MVFFFQVSNNRNFRMQSVRKSSNFANNVKIIAMKSLFILALCAVVVLSSCSVYRAGQTPDDVYYSPARVQQAAGEGNDYVQGNSDRNDGRRYNDGGSYSGYDEFATPEDRWLMMRVRNRSRWSVFDDYNYYSPFDYSGFGGFTPGFSLGFNNYNSYNPFGYSYYNHFNDYWGWNSYYNPYYSSMIGVNPKTDPEGYTRLRNFNMSSYRNNNYNNSRTATRTNYGVQPRYNTTNNSSTNNRTLGNSFRRVFSNSNSDRNTYSTPSQDRPVRSYSPSNNNSSYSPRSSGGSSSGGSSNSGSSGSGSRPSRR